MKYTKRTNEAKMLEEIRDLLGLTIEDFIYQMNWANTKYYDFVRNGRKRTGDSEKKPTHPTIDKVFNGINFAIKNFPEWKNHSVEITSIVVKNLLPSI